MNPIWIIVPLVFSVFVIQESFEEQPDQLDWKIEQLIAKHVSDESKKDEIFLIYHKLPTGNVSFRNLGSEDFFSSFVFDVEIQQADILEIKIPRNFPYTNNEGVFGDIAVLVNGQEKTNVLKMTDCFLHYSIPINGNSVIELAASSYPASSYPFIGETVPNQCLVETLLLPPKIQQQVGISADQIMCKSDMFKMKKISSDSVLCIKYRSSQKLVERGFAIFMEDVTTSEMLCKSHGGKWLEPYKECENVSEQACKSMSGSYDECGSMCRHYPKQDKPVACLMGCAKLCFLK